MMQMKLITNESLQTLEVFVNTIVGLKSYLLQPQESKVIPAEFITSNILKLQKRRMLSVQNYN